MKLADFKEQNNIGAIDAFFSKAGNLVGSAVGSSGPVLMISAVGYDKDADEHYIYLADAEYQTEEDGSPSKQTTYWVSNKAPKKAAHVW